MVFIYKNLREDIKRIKEVMGIEMKPKVVRKDKFTNKYGEEITMVLFDDGDVNFKHTDFGNEFFPIKSLIRKDSDGNLMFKVILHQEEKDFVNNFLRDTKYQSESESQTITESRDMFFKRRQSEYREDLLNSFEWMEVEEADSFEEYIEFILRHSIDSFFGHNDILVTSEEIDELLPLALQTLRNDGRLMRRIRRHYDTYNSSRNFDETITESKDRFLMRRELEFNNYVNNHFGNVNPQRFDSFEDYLKYVLRYAIMIFFTNVADEGDLKRDEMEELIPIALYHLENNRDLYNEIKKEFFKEINSEQRMNESKEMLLVKRRIDALLDYIEASYDWLSPRAFTDFDDFLKRVAFSATRDFTVDEIGGEYEELLKIREKLEPMVLELIKNHPIYDEIYDHFIANQ
jgi:hypothetical protein